MCKSTYMFVNKRPHNKFIEHKQLRIIEMHNFFNTNNKVLLLLIQKDDIRSGTPSHPDTAPSFLIRKMCESASCTCRTKHS